MTQFIIVFIISISFSAGFLFGVFWVAAHQNHNKSMFITDDQLSVKQRMLGIELDSSTPPPKKGS